MFSVSAYGKITPKHLRKEDKKLLRDKVKKYYLDEERNCAESMLLAANEEYSIGLTDSEIEMMRGFGGGLGYGLICGAISGSVAALSKLICCKVDKDTSHDITCGFVGEVEKRFENTNCAVLTPVHKKEDIRCYELLLQIADILEDTIAKNRT